MNMRIRSIGAAALVMATSAAYADGHISVNINPFGWGAPPPVVYAPPRDYYDYAPPPVVYYGQGQWGDRRWGHDERGGRGRGDRGRSDHRDGGHDRGDHQH